MNNFVCIDITANRVLDEISFAVKCNISWIWLNIPEGYLPSPKLIKDILAIAEGEAELWVECNDPEAYKPYANGFIFSEIGKRPNMPWAVKANSIADLKNKELEKPDFILVHYEEFNRDQHNSNKKIETHFPKPSYGWEILSINTPILVYGVNSEKEIERLSDFSLFRGFEIK